MKFIKLVVIGLLLNLATLTEAEAEAEAAGDAEADPQLQYIQSQGFFKLPPSYQQRDFGLPPNSNEPFSTFALKFVVKNATFTERMEKTPKVVTSGEIISFLTR